MTADTPVMPGQRWFKSSYSGGNQTECVEAAHLTAGAAVRDSKDPHGPQLAFGTPSWAVFVAALRSRQLD
jgi:hypothetical protein